MPRLPSVATKLNGPVSERIRIRRTTVLLVVLFVGLGALWLAVRTETSSSGQGGVFVEPKPGGGFTITRVPTTTTKVPSTSTTTPAVPATTAAPPTTRGISPETTAPEGTAPPTTAPGVHSPAASSTTTSTTVAAHGAGGAGESTG
jgi:hypothetical protein